jgi:hypothetical protein
MKNSPYLIIIFLIASLSAKTFAQGDLLITPNRVVFEGRKQKEELNLINTGKETTTFSVSFVQRRMNGDGSFEVIEEPDPGQLFASPYLRIYPRQVTLAPGEAQVVMLQFTRKADMEDGEYRSHLYFRSEKNYSPLGSDAKEQPKTVSVQLIPIFGMSIPVIIRTGNVSATASLTDLKLTEEEEDAKVSFTLNRTGKASIYGDLKVEYIPVKGKPYDIGTMKGIAVYTNLTKRHVSIRLNKTPGMSLKGGKIRIRYTSRDDAKKYEVYAEEELQL